MKQEPLGCLSMKGERLASFPEWITCLEADAAAFSHAIEIIKAAKRWADGKSRDDEVDALLQLRSLLSPEQYKEA